MRPRPGRALRAAGSRVRLSLVWAIRLYRATFGRFVGGRCRFYPSCSAYAEQAIAQLGAVRGVALAVWRVMRCSPLSKGGVDYPPGWSPAMYDADIQPENAGPVRVPGGAPA
jgi:uncharacterized protein